MIAKYGTFEYALAERYRFEEELGRGAMGTVYRAQDVRLGRPIAIKMLHPMLTNELGVARFQSEIRIAASLHHPNIIGVHESGEVDGRLYFVMDYLGGETLRARLNREKQLSIDESLSIVDEVAKGLQYAHDHGVVHRDVKPENIVLSEGRACLLDFGLARALGDVDADRLTASGLSVGTPQYLSPEQASAEKEVGPRSDQYALACVLYEMLVGEPPFTGPTATSIAMRHISEAAPLLRTRRHTTTRSLEAAVARALQKIPADRFVDVRAFVRACCESAVQPLMPPANASAMTVKWLRKLALVAGGLTVLATGIFAIDRRRRTGEVQYPNSDASSEGRLARRIAVLYFEDNSANRDLKYLADGITESIIGQLSEVPTLFVVSRNGVRQFRDNAVPFQQMATTLSVGSIVEGSVQRAGDSVRVSVGFVDGTSGLTLASIAFTRSLGSVLELQDEVGQQVSSVLRRRLGEQIHLRHLRIGTTNQPAIALLLQAERLRKDAKEIALQPGDQTRAELVNTILRRADGLLAQAEQDDPNWNAPITARGWLSFEASGLQQGRNQRVDLLNIAIGHADRAIKRDSSDASTRELRGTAEWALATVGFTAKVDQRLVDAARRDLMAAVADDSMRATAWATLSTVLRFAGRPEQVREANLYAVRALTADAYLENSERILNELFRSSLHLGDVDAARKWCQRGKGQAPRDPRFVECTLTLMLYDNSIPDPRAAWAVVDTLNAIDPPERARAKGWPYNPIHRRMFASVVSARAGQRTRALQELARSKEEVRADSVLAIDILLDEALLLHALGETRRASTTLDIYIRARGYRQFLAADPLYGPITRH